MYHVVLLALNSVNLLGRILYTCDINNILQANILADHYEEDYNSDSINLISFIVYKTLISFNSLWF